MWSYRKHPFISKVTKFLNTQIDKIQFKALNKKVFVNTKTHFKFYNLHKYKAKLFLNELGLAITGALFKVVPVLSVYPRLACQVVVSIKKAKITLFAAGVRRAVNLTQKEKAFISNFCGGTRVLCVDDAKFYTSFKACGIFTDLIFSFYCIWITANLILECVSGWQLGISYSSLRNITGKPKYSVWTFLKFLEQNAVTFYEVADLSFSVLIFCSA